MTINFTFCLNRASKSFYTRKQFFKEYDRSDVMSMLMVKTVLIQSLYMSEMTLVLNDIFVVLWY